MNTFREFLNEQVKFKLGTKLKHKDFKGEILVVTGLYNNKEEYNNDLGVSGITVKSEDGNEYDLYFDTETLRKQKRPLGSKSEAYKKITVL